MDLTRVDIDEIVIDQVPLDAPELPARIRAAVANALRERGVAEASTNRTAARVGAEVTRSISR